MRPNMVTTTLPWLLFTLLPPLLLFTKLEAKVPAIIVFGDSTVDAGNNNQVPTLVRSDFAPYGRDFEGGKPTGRFSNGRLVTDFVSEAFGLKPFVPAYLDPGYGIEDFATGVTFASAGSGYDNATAHLTNVIPLWKQLENFKDYKNKLSNHFGITKAEQILQEALYMTSMGTNDIVLNYYLVPERSIQFTIEGYEDFLVSIADNFVVELYKLGARKISLGGLPPIGCLPLMRTLFFKSNKGDCREEFNNLARNFNGMLKDLVSKLRKEVKDIKLVFSNTLDKSLQIIKSPHLYAPQKDVPVDDSETDHDFDN
ncbi:hypothetical protein Syun_026883 [Stephania yunnanensis]|uniref:GDSL esterase/lipase n=1 Tax=Stephania yunnanensis TaxID=152371 RepID=A0AAP0EHW2_9MAGN